MFFAYRDFVGDPDHVLEEFGFGRAHHRVLHFVYRYPGLKVADLLEVLRITKQSLGRVLKQLVDEGYIVQKAGDSDRRQRLLFATAKGEALVGKLAGLQTDRIVRALQGLDTAGIEAVRYRNDALAKWDGYPLAGTLGRVLWDENPRLFERAKSAGECASAPSAMARATSALTAPCASISPASTPSSSVLAALE